MSASQAIFRTVEAVTGPVNSRLPVCSVVAPGRKGPWPVPCASGLVPGRSRVAGDVSEAGEQVAVVDGDHDLRAESSGGGQGAGGEGDLGRRRRGRRGVSAAACAGPGGTSRRHSAVLRPSFPASARGWRRRRLRLRHRRPRSPVSRCRAAVSGWVVRGLVAVFMTVRRCSNCSAVAKISRCWSPWRGLRMKAPWSWRRSSSEGSAPSWSSASVQFRADPGQEVGVVLGRGAGQGVFHPGGGLGVADVPDPVQGQGDDGRGPGRDLAGGDGGTEFLPYRRQRFARESLPRQQIPGEGTAGGGPRRRRSAAAPAGTPWCSGTRRPRPAESAAPRNRAAAASRHPRHPRQLPIRMQPHAPTAPDALSGPAVPSAESSRQPVVHAVPAFGGGGGLLPGPVHGPGRHELQVLHGPRELLHRAGEIRRLPEVPQGGVRGRRQTHLPEQRQGGIHTLNTGHTGGPGRSDAPARVLNGDEIPDGFHESISRRAPTK